MTEDCTFLCQFLRCCRRESVVDAKVLLMRKCCVSGENSRVLEGTTGDGWQHSVVRWVATALGVKDSMLRERQLLCNIGVEPAKCDAG